MLIYQICPKCNGQGTISNPSRVDDNVNEWIDTNAGDHVCNVCYGAKIIPTPNELISPNDQYILVKRSEYTISQVNPADPNGILISKEDRLMPSIE